MGLSKVLLHEKGYYIFKFNSAEARENILAMGPWYISNKQILLKKWKEGIDITREACSKAPVWVKFHGIPLSYWTAEGLSYIASGVGKPLFLDKVTERLDPLPYARICVEIDVAAPLPRSLPVIILNEDEHEERSVDVTVEYQNRPPSCSVCKTFGHSLIKCPNSNYQWVPKSSTKAAVGPGPSSSTAAVPSNVTSPSVASEEGWTVIAQKNPPALVSPSIPLNPPSPSPMTASNPFAALVDPDCISPDCNSLPPLLNPLTDKLKIVDEKEGRDLKLKAKAEVVGSPSAKRRNKGRGRNSPP